jgi:excinuclease ABC subunit A
MGELLALANDYGIPTDVPVKKLSAKAWSIIQHGVPERNFGGLDGFFTWLDRKKYKMHIRIFAARWRSYLMCPTCEGQRLNADALAYKIAKLSMIDVAKMSVDQALGWIESLAWDDTSRKIVSDPLNQIRSRLRYLQRVGLGYLALDRPLRTLSGGEATRVTLTTSLGSDLVSMLYVLDEPTVGLHPQDTAQLTNAILDLRDRGNTVLVVEHEPGLIMKADWLVEIGPQAGQLGGKLQFAGTIEELSKSKTLTAKYLFADSVVTHAGPDGIPEASAYGSGTEPEVHVHGADSKWLTIREASGRNLKSIDVSIPLGQLVVVTGVSGSGKSTLVLDTLGAELERYFGRSGPVPLPFESVEGLESLKDVLLVDQEPISLSLRSNPATYSRVFDEIRKVFAATVDAKARGMTAGQFSFNNESGRCPRCEGDGFLAIDMQFLADIQTVCPECHGSRYTPEVLAVKYRDRSIADCLAMSILEAKEFFRGQAKLQSRLEPLIDLGLGYLQLGQSAPTLSAGEMQRLKLATYLTDSSNRSTLFILDEPTTGLHFYDIDRLLHSLRKLIASGHSVLMIEHNEQVIRAADYCIDMGPGPSEAGGQVVTSGVIAEMIASKKSIFANV